MDIRVYNDEQKVFEGELDEFLFDNDNDEWLTEECAKLNVQTRVEFREISGEWVIEKNMPVVSNTKDTAVTIINNLQRHHSSSLYKLRQCWFD